jgi:hypothetical protein
MNVRGCILAGIILEYTGVVSALSDNERNSAILFLIQ